MALFTFKARRIDTDNIETISLPINKKYEAELSIYTSWSPLPTFEYTDDLTKLLSKSICSNMDFLGFKKINDFALLLQERKIKSIQDMIYLWNEYCISSNKKKEQIFDYSNETEFYNKMFDTPAEAALAVLYGSIDPEDKYITFKNNGLDLETFSDIDYVIDFEKLYCYLKEDK